MWRALSKRLFASKMPAGTAHIKVALWSMLMGVFCAAVVTGIPQATHRLRIRTIENLAPAPPMGWNGWNRFRCGEEVNESLIKETADALVISGMRDAGYRYVVLDDCWQIARDASGNIVADQKKFPSGMKSLGDYIHAQGLKFGIYTSAGRITCEKRPGSFGYEEQDAETYAAWGVDYIKVDWCGIEYLDTETQYKKWRNAIERAGRPMVLSIAIADIDNIDHNNVWEWGRGVGHLWRTTRDILDYWPDILRIIDRNSSYAQYAGSNGWNDADMLQVGNGGMTHEEYKSHFSLWAMMASPMMAGNDVRFMTRDIARILTNREVIAVNQDVLGKQGQRVAENNGLEIWMKPLSDSRTRAVVLFNRTEQDSMMTLDWQSVGIDSPGVLIRDLWLHRDMGEFSRSYEAPVPAHGVVMLLLTVYD